MPVPIPPAKQISRATTWAQEDKESRSFTQSFLFVFHCWLTVFRQLALYPFLSAGKNRIEISEGKKKEKKKKYQDFGIVLISFSIFLVKAYV